MKSRCGTFILLLTLSPAAWSDVPQAHTTAVTSSALNQASEHKISKIVIVSNPIFDESDEDAFFIHDWANYLHINTRESTILNKLAFDEGDTVSVKDLQEAQRILRKEAYLRDAEISFTQLDPNEENNHSEQVILVETWDNWSLLPTFSLSHSGGESKFSVGIKEDNLLGYGIRTRLRYSSDDDRSGYKFAIEAPLDGFIKHSTVAVDFHDNSDGQATQLLFNKPFYTLDSLDMYGVNFIDNLRTDTIKQNGEDIREFAHQIDYLNLQYGRRISRNATSRSRLLFGITQDKHQFSHVLEYPDAPLPQDRDFLYPWLAYEYLDDDFRVLNNIHLISHNEDVNLGWHHFIKLGIETQDLNDSDPLGYHINYYASRGYQAHNHLTLLSFSAEGVFATAQADRYKASFSAEYFYHITPKWTSYSKVRLTGSKNNYLDQPMTLGDETGVRGYPNDYQHGDNQWLFTTEIRNYPNINLYQLADLGWAVFTDLGEASGGNYQTNAIDGPIGSVGIGARIYSSRSSYGNVAHINFTVPYRTGPNVDKWEWQFQVKRHF
ncbi:ShlB/FhaC/HecB family hemolysin secretion/activation protein [Shewanella sp. Scap07]|uniref:ShlB/FhaC/HecB family hemolysin secretion/activation protein n=1 Tax=Shewanella TaxID=22 RepID=UPI0004B8F24E